MPLSARGNNDDDFDDDFGDDEDMPEPDSADFSDYEDIDFDGWDTFEEDEY